MPSGLGLQPMALDISVVHPFQAAAHHREADAGRAASNREREKLRFYADSCSSSGWAFNPVVAETCGSWGTLAQKFFNRPARKIAMRSGSSLKDVSAEMWSTLAVGLAQSVANMLLASAPHATAMIACAQSSLSRASNQPLAVIARGSASPCAPPATTLSARSTSTSPRVSGEVDCLRPPSLLLVAQTASAGLGACVTTPLPLGPTVPPLASVPGMHSVSPADPRGHPAPDLFSHDPYSSSLKPTAPVPQACGASKYDFSVRIREAEQHWPPTCPGRQGPAAAGDGGDAMLLE